MTQGLDKIGICKNMQISESFSQFITQAKLCLDFTKNNRITHGKSCQLTHVSEKAMRYEIR